MASFNVPKKYQQQALLVGIILALLGAFAVFPIKAVR